MYARRTSQALSIALLAATAIAANSPALAEWQPKKPVEFVIMAGTGGGADQMARLMQSIIQKNEYSNQPFIPINKPGGSGAEAMVYLNGKQGDDHLVMISLSSFYTTPLRNPGLGIDITTFTPIARMAKDTFLLWVNSDTPVNSLEEYVAAVKSAGKDWKMGGTGKGQEDSLVTAMLEREFDLAMTYVPFPGGGTVAKNLIGDHINSTVNNPSEQMGFFEAGKSRPLMALTPERLPQFQDVPTSKELGHPDLLYFMQRTINGPPEMSKEAQDYYIGVFEQVFNSKEWQDFCASDGIFCDDWVSGEDLGKVHVEEREKHQQLLETMGQG